MNFWFEKCNTFFEINEIFFYFSLESTGASASPSASGNVANAASTGIYSEVKACPRCQVLAVKMHDGSCNHMTCAVCGVEFCWLCMKEISDLHYLSPSGIIIRAFNIPMLSSFNLFTYAESF